MYTVKTVYKDHLREPYNVAFMHCSLMEKMRAPFIDSDLLYRGALVPLRRV
jgi:hypothetical protein